MCFKSLNILLQLKFYNKNFNKYKPLSRLKPFILTQIFTKKTHRSNKSHGRKHEGSEKTENWKRWWQRRRRHQNKTSTTSNHTFSFAEIVSRIFYSSQYTSQSYAYTRVAHPLAQKLSSTPCWHMDPCHLSAWCERVWSLRKYSS